MWIRGHWAIESRLHWTRDVTFAEGHSQVRAGTGLRMMASLRNLAINLYRLTRTENIAAATRHTARDARRALKIVGITTPRPNAVYRLCLSPEPRGSPFRKYDFTGM
jgi:hypothetical protein